MEIFKIVRGLVSNRILEYVLGALLVTMLLGCRSEEGKDTVPIRVGNLGALSIDKFVTELTYDVLPESEESILSPVYHVEPVDGVGLVMLNHAHDAYFWDGSDLEQICCKGDGPLEFSEITSMDYEPSENVLYLCDRKRSTILTYSLEEKEVLSSRKMDFMPLAIKSVEQEMLVLTFGSDYLIKIVDKKDFTEKGEFIKSAAFSNFPPSVRPFSGSVDKVGVALMMVDSIYTYDSDNGSQGYALSNKDGLSHLEPQVVREAILKRSMSIFEGMTIPVGASSRYGSIDFINLFNPFGGILVHDTKENAAAIISPDQLEGSTILFKRFWMFSQIADDGYVYSVRMPDEMLKSEIVSYVDTHNTDLSEVFGKLSDFLNDNPDYENPIIFKYKIDEQYVKSLILASGN